jgi:hypothetical protein
MSKLKFQNDTLTLTLKDRDLELLDRLMNIGSRIYEDWMLQLLRCGLIFQNTQTGLVHATELGTSVHDFEGNLTLVIRKLLNKEIVEYNSDMRYLLTLGIINIGLLSLGNDVSLTTIGRLVVESALVRITTQYVHHK